jgi:hypothetical protein
MEDYEANQPGTIIGLPSDPDAEPRPADELLEDVLANEERVKQAPLSTPFKYTPPSVLRHDRDVAAQVVRALRIQAEEAKKLTPLGKSILASNRRRAWVRKAWRNFISFLDWVVNPIDDFIKARFAETPLVTVEEIDRLVSNSLELGGPTGWDGEELLEDYRRRRLAKGNLSEDEVAEIEELKKDFPPEELVELPGLKPSIGSAGKRQPGRQTESPIVKSVDLSDSLSDEED